MVQKKQLSNMSNNLNLSFIYFQPNEIDDIDLTDPELNKAAVKIQASFRGHMVRKDHEEEELAQ